MVSRVHNTNPTGIRRISQTHIEAVLYPECKPLELGVVLSDVADLALPGNARLAVGVYSGRTQQMIALGTSEAPQHTSRHVLEEIDPDSALKLRFLAWAEDSKKILASSTPIRPRSSDEPEGKRSLIPVVAADLGEVPYRLLLAESERPVLQFNIRVPELKDQLASPIMMNGFIPTIIKSALVHLALNRTEDIEDPSAWQNEYASWLHLLGEEPDAIPTEDDAEDLNQWADEIVRKLAAQKQFLSRVTTEIGENDD